MAISPHSDSQTIVLTVPSENRGQRLDRWLAEILPNRSRSEIQRWIKAGQVLAAGVPAKASHKVEPGEIIVVHVPAPPEESHLQAEELPLTVLYEDPDLAVIDKPAGMVVHPAPGHPKGTLVNAILHRFPDIEGIGGEKRPGIVHRLDKETSGLLIIAKNDRSHRYLQQQFAKRQVYKEYLALVEGDLQPPHGRIVAPIGRHPVHRKRQAVLLPDPVTGVSKGREAITEYHVVRSYSARLAGGSSARFTLVRAILHTGRTHQIRVHFAWLKHPLVGDTVYGYRRQRLNAPRHFLHAHRLRFRLPSSGEEREFTSPLPADLQQILDQLDASSA
jgi:23S rRNA pseudouridine1911/1915/1917 synthase